MEQQTLNKDQFAGIDYGPLKPYMEKESITDINWNGKALWIDDVETGRYKTEDELDAVFINRLVTKLSNVVSKQFNKNNPVLEAQTETLRISVVHPEVSNTGTVISIRKIPVSKKLEKADMISRGYCSEQIAELLELLVKAKMNIIVSGLPGCGKTELLKYMAGFIKSTDRIISIEDTLEMHLPSLYPEKDILEMLINPKFTYTDGIKASMRLLPNWLMISEIRQEEAKYLMESMSTGTHCLTTVHTESADKIPARIANMTDDKKIINDVYRYLDVGIHLRKTTNAEDSRVTRTIEQICFFEHDENENENKMHRLVEDRRIVTDYIPQSILEKFISHKVDVPILRREEKHPSEIPKICEL